MERARAEQLTERWVELHVAVEPPSREAIRAVERMLALVPEAEAAAAITATDERPRIAVLADVALYLAWALPGSADAPAGARCRRIPLYPGAVELSERQDRGRTVRHWSFELDQEPLVFRTSGDDEPERFARALAGALGWPQ